MALTGGHLVGREQELAAIVRLIEAPEQLPRVAVLTGEAGIGKTTLWLAGIDAAAAGAYRIMSCRPSEAETRFAFGGLADLLGDAGVDVLPELPPIQRRALEAALLLGEPETHADGRAVAAAFLGSAAFARPSACSASRWTTFSGLTRRRSRRFATRSPTSSVIAFAALLAVRGGVPPWLRHAVPEERLRTIEIGALSVGALRELLRARLDATFPRPTLIRLWQTSGGNPFFALEVASALRRRGDSLALSEELPFPTDLDELLRARLDGLSAAALEVARAVAALADPTRRSWKPPSVSMPTPGWPRRWASVSSVRTRRSLRPATSGERRRRLTTVLPGVNANRLTFRTG